jgi:serine/threonine-protein kinase
MTGAAGDSGLLAELERLAEMDPAEREAQLSEIERESAPTARRLRRMLQHGEQAEAWFEKLETAIGHGIASELDSAWAPGRIVGPYRLERLLGTGGMDAVFLARKADGELKRPVALKLVPAGLIDAAALERLRRERDLLASLSHPNIAQLLDAGIADDGQPWIAMEYIEGHALMDWCRARAPGLADRVRVLASLVDAVQFAHRNLVVHGDLKPANVRIDESGRLRLLDFGISRLLDEVAARNGKADAPPAFTPGYAAPELQQGARASVASDVYALGVMLAELIELPAAGRSRRPMRELALIAERAAHHDPEQRYDGARQFGEELRRWLALEPVEARNGGWLYRFGKRLRRHPLASTGIALAALAIVGFGAYSRIQAERFAEQRDSARQLAAFMEQVFLGADPEIARDGDLSARTLLDRGLEALGPELASEGPAGEVQARLASIMGRTYQRLGDYPAARRLLEDARDSGTLTPTERTEVLLELADNHHLSGRFEAAEAAYREQLTVVTGDAERARALAGLARTLSQVGRPAEAIELLDESIALTRADPSAAPWRLAQRLNDAGSAWFRMGDYERATTLLAEALSVRRDIDQAEPDQPGSPATATLLNNLGLMHYLGGSPDRARPALTEALAMRRELLDENHPDLAQTLTNLGLLEKDYGDLATAVVMLEEALAIREASLEPDHYRIAQAMVNLATVQRDSGDTASAEDLFGESLARLTERLGPRHPQVAVVHTELGQLLLDTNRHAEAESAFRESLSIRREALGDDHPHLAWSLLGLGRSLHASGRTEEALPHLREAVAIRQQVLPPDNPLRLLTEEKLREAERDLAAP